MESEGVRLKQSGAKRKRKDVISVESDGDVKRRSMETRSKALVGLYVTKDVEGTVVLGKVVECDKGEYRVIYHDGDCEYMGNHKLRRNLIRDSGFDKKLRIKRKELDELILKKFANDSNAKLGNAIAGANSRSQIMSSNFGNSRYENVRFPIDADVDADTELDFFTNSCKSAHRVSFSHDASGVPPPVLPPSTGNIGLPDECVADLLSVYAFLRSFSIPLCLYPFGIKDFVGALNCSVQNTLLDSIHVALMQCLQRHFESLIETNSDDSELASKYIRSMDWSLIDLLTWPVSLVQYLIISKCTKGQRWKEFYSCALQKGYYALSVCSKLMVLQKLCDDVLDSPEIRAEIDMHKTSEVISIHGVTVVPSEGGPRRVHPRLSKPSASDDGEAMDIIGKHKTRSSCNSYSLDYESTISVSGSDDQDGNGFECRLCGMDGTLLCCDNCPSVFHSRCVGLSKRLPEGKWFCPECTINWIDLRISKEMSLRGAELFGVDPYEQVFMGTCNHLLVTKFLLDSDLCIRYYHRDDIPTVLQTLNSSVHHNTMYAGLCEAIQRYWENSKDVLSITESPTNLTSKMVDGECLAPSPAFLGKKSYDTSQLPMNEKVACSITDYRSANMTVSQEKSKCCRSTSQQQIYPSDLSHLELGGKSKPMKYASCTSKSVNSSDIIDISKYTGKSLKAQAYINHYAHGNYAASAASAFIRLKKKLSAYKSSESRANIQLRAFSSAPFCFFWPDSENKLVELPSIRCGWCDTCKSPLSKKRCLLNAAALNAIRGAMRRNSATRPLKDGRRDLSGIATYISNLEEILRSLTIGPFRSPAYRNTWRNQVEKAVTCSEIKSLLLELEKNIRLVAFKSEWIKLVDEWSVDTTVIQNTAYAVGSGHKRGRGGRRGKKQGAMPEVTADKGKDKSESFIWWRGGLVSKLIFRRGLLPCLMTKESARHGRREIPSVSYVKGFEVPKRTQQCVWRAAVEVSKNMSQLAMQIRYLDNHVRWGDLARPTQDLDGKGSETQASLFRNASICGKHYLEGQTQYAVDFGSQKHLPSCMTRNAVEVEKSEAGKQICWFLEASVPLYLIKEYEEKMEKVPSQPAEKANELSELQKRQLKASRKDIFSYLTRRRDNLEICSCASCQLDVLIGNAVTCARCKGYCHTQCMVASMPNINKEVNLLETCKHCYESEVVATKENHDVANTNFLQFKETQNALTVTKDTPTSCLQTVKPQIAPTICKGGNRKDSVMNCALDHSFEKLSRKGSNLKSESRSRLCSWGLIWKKKSGEGNGLEFRLKNILMKGNPNSSHVRCDLCKKAYNKDFMYISCETCNKWYHADALELDEERLFDLMGFRCCKCRRIKSPICPYTDPVKKPVSEGRNLRRGDLKQGNMGVDDQLARVEGANPFSSLSRAEHVSDEKTPEVNMNSLPGSGNISVGRHIMQNNTMVFLPENNFTVDTSVNLAENSLHSAVEASSCKGFNISRNDLDGVMSDNEGLNYEDMEFEPWNYVSYTKFSASDDSQKHVDGVDSSRIITENLKKSSTLSSNGKIEQCGASTNQQECQDSLAPPVRVGKCRICNLAEPSPDRSCEICSQWMHSLCSPFEDSSGQGPWRCVNCREWQ
ncbi:DDT domain-containing protein PTM-like isoform X2 [Apium graveolens]|uniref:DDT domain-containing protein PTM-like isoform X2 n=1 Tax=Apium graveolens TaxID=4045 RepID=UPI003D7BF6D7